MKTIFPLSNICLKGLIKRQILTTVNRWPINYSCCDRLSNRNEWHVVEHDDDRQSYDTSFCLTHAMYCGKKIK